MTPLPAILLALLISQPALACRPWTYDLRQSGQCSGEGEFSSCHNPKVFSQGGSGQKRGFSCAYLNLGTQGLPDESRNGMGSAPKGGNIKKGDGSNWQGAGGSEKYVLPGDALTNATVERCQKALQDGNKCCELDNMDGCEDPGNSKISSCAPIVELYDKICTLSRAQGGLCVVKNSPKLLKALLAQGKQVDAVIAEFGVDQENALKEILASGIPASKVHAIYYSKGNDAKARQACQAFSSQVAMIVNFHKEETVDPGSQRSCCR